MIIMHPDQFSLIQHYENSLFLPKNVIKKINPADTYHVDQGLRNILFQEDKSLKSPCDLEQKILNNYKTLAILPMSLLECAGINTKQYFKETKIENDMDEVYKNWCDEGNGIPKVPAIDQIMKYFRDNTVKKLKRALTNKIIDDKLIQQRRWYKGFGTKYIDKCREALPQIYENIIYDLCWDRFLRLHHKDIIRYSRKRSCPSFIARINHQIMDFGRYQHLNMLRYFCSLEEIEWSIYNDIKNNPIAQKYLKRLRDIHKKGNKLHSNSDLGDCEYIHVAINGQSSPCLTKRRRVDVFTTDDPSQIKCRLVLCLFYYYSMDHIPYRYIKTNKPHKMDNSYFSCIYSIDKHNGQIVEKIKVQDYVFQEVYLRLLNEALPVNADHHLMHLA